MIAKPEANIPFTKEATMEELKEMLFVQATQIAVVLDGPDADRFLGIEIETWNDRLHDDDRAKIDLKRFNIYRVLDRAYDFAFQTGAYWKFDGDDHFELAGFSSGVPSHSFDGERNPYLNDDSKVRHVTEMALARYNLSQSWNMTIRDLSLLAAMTEPAVRNSLSKEGIQTEGKPARVGHETALKWLLERRGFIPTQAEEAEAKSREQHIDFLLGSYEFPEILERIINSTPDFDLQQASIVTKIPQNLVHCLMTGEKTTLDIGLLQRLGAYLNVRDVPKFVAKGIEYSLRRTPGQ